MRAGMRLGEALSRCPSLVLVAADPVRAEAAWEESLRRLEAIGAAVEPAQPGEAYFALEPLRGIHGEPGVILARARRALGAPARLGAGPNRISARAAAMRMRARRPAAAPLRCRRAEDARRAPGRACADASLRRRPLGR